MKNLTLIIISIFIFVSCNNKPQQTSDSGVAKASVKVDTDLSGHTIEQKNIMSRLNLDNKPGSIKHLYIISAYSGDVMIYSTVNGKVTSSGKRLTPATVSGFNKSINSANNYVNINGIQYITDEVIQDDGTYGSSVEYIYWWDSKGIYHQQYVTGGMIVHISDHPIAVSKVILNLENSGK